MLWLSGVLPESGLHLLDARRIGLMDSPANHFADRALRSASWLWAADNGAFSARWDEREWWTWLASDRNPRESCLFAVMPDVVADAEATVRLAERWSALVRDAGYRAAFVAQDGSDRHPPPWDLFDVLFIGGSTEFKLGAEAVRLMAEAHHREVPVHVGRVNSLRRLNWAREQHANTADGTFIRWAPDVNVARVERWLAMMDENPVLWDAAVP